MFGFIVGFLAAYFLYQRFPDWEMDATEWIVSRLDAADEETKKGMGSTDDLDRK